MSSDGSRSLRDMHVRSERIAMLALPHVKPLVDFTEKLRQKGQVDVPNFDPLDGGIQASALFLFEKPGPMTVKKGQGQRPGSGFISRDNDDPTAEATFKFMRLASIDRRLTVLWNVVPWWNGTRKVTAHELREGAELSKELATMLPKLRAIMLVGRTAGRARRHFEAMDIPLFTSSHPSPLVRASWPDRWNSIPLEWGKLALTLRARD